MALQLGGTVSRTGQGEYGRTELTPDRRLAAVPGLAGDVERVDEPRRRHHRGAGRASRPRPRAPARRWRPCTTPSAGSSGCSSTPRWCTPTGAARSSTTSSSTCAGACRAGRTSRSSSSRWRRCGPRSARDRVLCALSGGVDSAVAAALVHKAIGDQLTCVFVDTGLMRSGEADQVEDTFRRQFKIDLVHVKAADRYFAALAGRDRPRAQAQDHRRAVHPDLRGGGARPRRRRPSGGLPARPGRPAPARARASWSRARSTPT